MAANMTDDLLNDDMDFMLSRVAENISFFFIEIENFRGEGKSLMRHTHDTTFPEKLLDFYKILDKRANSFSFYF
jgi:hypothetical protein